MWRGTSGRDSAKYSGNSDGPFLAVADRRQSYAAFYFTDIWTGSTGGKVALALARGKKWVKETISDRRTSLYAMCDHNKLCLILLTWLHEFKYLSTCQCTHKYCENKLRKIINAQRTSTKLALKSTSFALKPGVSALAILLANVDILAFRSGSAWWCIPNALSSNDIFFP